MVYSNFVKAGKRVLCALVAVMVVVASIGVMIWHPWRGVASTYSVGFGGGGALYNAQINPQDDNNIFIGCDMGSMFVTTDGVNYKNPNLTGRINNPARISYSPHDKNIVYSAMHNVVQISHDRGRTWDWFFPNADGIAGVTNDGLAYRPIVKTIGVPAGSYSTGQIICVYADPNDANTVYALSKGASYGNDPGSGGGLNEFQRLPGNKPPTIYVTHDGGKTWAIFNEEIQLTNHPYTNPNTGVTSQLNFIDSRETHNPRGLSYTSDFGERFAYADLIIHGNELHMTSNNGYFRFSLATGQMTYQKQMITASSRFCVDKDGKLSTYAIVIDTRYPEFGVTTPSGLDADGFPVTYYRHVVKSTDGGTTFATVTTDFAKRLGLGVDDVVYEDLRVSGDKVFVLYESFRTANLTVTPKRYGGWYSGIAYTADSGATWTKITNEAGKENNIGNTVYTIGVSPTNPKHVIYMNYGGARETRDGGTTWRSVQTRTVREDGDKKFVTTNGIEPAHQLTLAVDPFDPAHQFAGWIDSSVQETFDGGKSWLARADLFVTVDGTKYTSNIYAIAFDPHNRGHVLIGLCGGGNASVAKNNRNGKIIKSTDNGATFTDAVPNTFATGIVYDPQRANVVYATCVGTGLHKSTDGGVTWTPFNAGIAEQLLSDGTTGITLAGLVLANDGKTLIASGNGACYTLDTTTSATWSASSGPNGTPLISTKMPDGTLYACTAATSTYGDFIQYNGAQIRNPQNGGAYVSRDNGTTWRQIFDPTLTVRFIYADPRHADTLYIHAAQRVWKSTRGAATTLADWTPVEGLYFNSDAQTYTRHLMWPDPLDSRRILVSTNCGGTWNLKI